MPRKEVPIKRHRAQTVSKTVLPHSPPLTSLSKEPGREEHSRENKGGPESTHDELLSIGVEKHQAAFSSGTWLTGTPLMAPGKAPVPSRSFSASSRDDRLAASVRSRRESWIGG